MHTGSPVSWTLLHHAIDDISGGRVAVIIVRARSRRHVDSPPLSLKIHNSPAASRQLQHGACVVFYSKQPVHRCLPGGLCLALMTDCSDCIVACLCDTWRTCAQRSNADVQKACGKECISRTCRTYSQDMQSDMDDKRRATSAEWRADGVDTKGSTDLVE